VFKVTSNGTESVLHTFKGGPGGAHPDAGLIIGASGDLAFKIEQTEGHRPASFHSGDKVSAELFLRFAVTQTLRARFRQLAVTIRGTNPMPPESVSDGTELWNPVRE
jgi:hypothetical protein